MEGGQAKFCNFTMDVEEAIVASDYIECNNILGVHFDTVDTIKINQEAAIQKFSDKGKQLLLVPVEDSFECA